METIKANSLMLNDWVKIKEPNKYAGAIGTIQTFSSLEGAYLAIYINDTNFGTFVTEVFCEDIEPIPLTAEILKKNGFEWRAYGVVLAGEDMALVQCGNYWKIKPNQYSNDTFCYIWYIHELQHALRLCGINGKEIVL